MGSTIGIGYQALSGKVFITLNGKEIHSCNFESSDAKVFPTFSMGSLEDRIQINFGQSDFLFNVKAKVNELQKEIFDEICEQP